MKEFELTLRLRNNLIKSKRLALGLKARECAERIGITYGKYLEYEGLRDSPLSGSRTGEPFKPSARALARFFGCTPEELWPDVILAVRTPEVVRTIRADEALALAKLAVPLELPATPEELLTTKAEYSDLEEAMATLTQREREALRARFWRDRVPEAALRRAYGDGYVGRERCRQVEAKAIRKLRHALRKIRMSDPVERSEEALRVKLIAEAFESRRAGAQGGAA